MKDILKTMALAVGATFLMARCSQDEKQKLPDDATKANQLSRKGDDFLVAGNSDSALFYFNQASAISPDWARPINRKSDAFHKKFITTGDSAFLDSAIQYSHKSFEMGVYSNPNIFKCASMMGRYKQKYDLALQYADRALFEEPDNRDFKAEKGNVLVEIGDKDASFALHLANQARARSGKEPLPDNIDKDEKRDAYFVAMAPEIEECYELTGDGTIAELTNLRGMGNLNRAFQTPEKMDAAAGFYQQAYELGKKLKIEKDSSLSEEVDQGLLVAEAFLYQSAPEAEREDRMSTFQCHLEEIFEKRQGRDGSLGFFEHKLHREVVKSKITDSQIFKTINSASAKVMH